MKYDISNFNFIRETSLDENTYFRTFYNKDGVLIVKTKGEETEEIFFEKEFTKTDHNPGLDFNFTNIYFELIPKPWGVRPYIVNDIEPDNITKGKDGKPFKLKFSHELEKGGIYGYSNTYMGAEIYIDPSCEIIEDKGDYIHTCLLVNGDHEFLHNEHVQSGIKYFQIGSPRSEYGGK